MLEALQAYKHHTQATIYILTEGQGLCLMRACSAYITPHTLPGLSFDCRPFLLLQAREGVWKIVGKLCMTPQAHGMCRAYGWRMWALGVVVQVTHTLSMLSASFLKQEENKKTYLEIAQPQAIPAYMKRAPRSAAWCCACLPAPQCCKKNPPIELIQWPCTGSNCTGQFTFWGVGGLLHNLEAAPDTAAGMVGI